MRSCIIATGLSLLLIGAPLSVCLGDELIIEDAEDLFVEEDVEGDFLVADELIAVEEVVEVVEAAQIEVEAPAAPAVPAALVAKQEAAEQQYIRRFRPLLTTELDFIRQTCELAKEQRPRIKAAGEAGLKEAAKEFLNFRQGRRVVINNNVRRINNTQPDPRKPIRDGLTAALEKTLKPEQVARYKDEVAKRAEDRKRAAILCVVSRLDGSLYLTREQREKITASITSAWQGNWDSWLAIYQHQDEYVPAIPDSCVVPHLNSDQKSIWSGLPKVALSAQNIQGGQAQPDDAWWGDKPADAAAQPAAAVLEAFERQ